MKPTFRPRLPQAAGLLALGMFLLRAAATETAHPFTMDDLLRVEDFSSGYGGGCALDPGDGAFAVVKVKSWMQRNTFRHATNVAGTEVWVKPVGDQPAFNLAAREPSLESLWAPLWGPGGRRLAMLGIRTGESEAHVWIWDRDSDRLREISSRPVFWQDSGPHPLQWIDGNRLLVPFVLPGCEHPSLHVDTAATRNASRFWQQASAGKTATASVLVSGIPQPLTSAAGLAVVNVGANDEVVLTRDFSDEAALSPDKRMVSYLRDVSWTSPRADQQMTLDLPVQRALAVCDLTGKAIFDRDFVADTVILGSQRWSADGKTLAFIARRSGVLTLFTWPQGGSVAPVDLGGLDLGLDDEGRRNPALEWSGPDELLIRARVLEKRSIRGERQDWWLVSRGSTPRNLTGSMPASPTFLVHSNKSGEFFALAAGEIWRISTGARPTPVTSTGGMVRSIIWPNVGQGRRSERNDPREGVASLLLEVRRDNVPHVVRWAKGEIADDLPATDTLIVRAHAPDRRETWCVTESPVGSTLAKFKPGEQPVTVVSINEHLHDVAPGRRTWLSHATLNGQAVQAMLLEPPTAAPDQKSPLVVWVYPGFVYRQGDPIFPLNQQVWLHPEILAARGYAVLFPSMPLGTFGVADDPLLRVTDGVLPAIDAAVRTGRVDPHRVFLLGHSFGGFGAYSLVTQTNRFRAAIALSGITDFLSIYGTIDARRRYSDFASSAYWAPALAEAGQQRLAQAPWRDLGRYLRNSPVSYVERVQTPLMIVHGDLDPVPIQQAEEFFTALYRQGKRAEYVRYFGEGHMLESPANIRDLSDRIFAWLGQFGGIKEQSKVSTLR